MDPSLSCVEDVEKQLLYLDIWMNGIKKCREVIRQHLDDTPPESSDEEHEYTYDQRISNGVLSML